MPARITIIKGDITEQKVDAIVNATNNELLGGGGVDGAIHRAAGRALLDECELLGGCATGDAKITKGYKLPAKWVVHTVGPVWHGGNKGEEALLASAYRRSLEVAASAGAKTVAFPSISTGAYRFPVGRAASIAIMTIRDYIVQHDVFDEIRIVCFDGGTLSVYQKAENNLCQ
ncbi:MAG: O-acetyl-ADP-ribose deacetylase [Bdellovibrionales bacterium]|jgi:O-acetyl-ADP-ribose deacetylase (regulator of RNase III)